MPVMIITSMRRSPSLPGDDLEAAAIDTPEGETTMPVMTMASIRRSHPSPGHDLQDHTIDASEGEKTMLHIMAPVVSPDVNDCIGTLVLALSTTRTLPTCSWVIC